MDKDSGWSFGYISDNLYELKNHGSVYVCLKAHGSGYFVVDKNRTAMVSKQTIKVDSYHAVIDDESHARVGWRQKVGAGIRIVAENLAKQLDLISDHHANYIARIIVE